MQGQNAGCLRQTLVQQGLLVVQFHLDQVELTAERLLLRLDALYLIGDLGAEKVRAVLPILRELRGKLE